MYEFEQDKEAYICRSVGDQDYLGKYNFTLDFFEAEKFISETSAEIAIQEMLLVNPTCYNKYDWKRNNSTAIIFGSDLEKPGNFEIQKVSISTNTEKIVSEADYENSSYNIAIENNKRRISWEEYRFGVK